ncbi:MAG: hypothetical protein R3F29_07600 [Planctomycetota bacterium]
MKSTLFATCALALLATAAIAQKPGEMAPEVPWHKTWNWSGMPEKQLSELRGSVVLLEFWGTH